MIDLHMHTTYSDGTDTVKEILAKAQNANLEVISITDHNSCAAYHEMQSFNINAFYQGDIIIGCEFTATFKQRMIEVLGYGFDYEKVQTYLNNFYNDEFVKKKTTTLNDRLIDKIKVLGLKCNMKKIEELKVKSSSFIRDVYNELRLFKENKEILGEDIFLTTSDFFRRGIYNINSKLFLNHVEFAPPLKEIINLVHNAGGIVFLAHPYQYKFNDTEKFLEQIYDENNFDGIEVFYTTFSEKQVQYLIDFASRRNLLISGGSDYHGTNKQHHDLAVGRGNLNINKDIIANWDIKYYK